MRYTKLLLGFLSISFIFLRARKTEFVNVKLLLGNKQKKKTHKNKKEIIKTAKKKKSVKNLCGNQGSRMYSNQLLLLNSIQIESFNRLKYQKRGCIFLYFFFIVSCSFAIPNQCNSRVI